MECRKKKNTKNLYQYNRCNLSFFLMYITGVSCFDQKFEQQNRTYLELNVPRLYGVNSKVLSMYDDLSKLYRAGKMFITKTTLRTVK